MALRQVNETWTQSRSNPPPPKKTETTFIFMFEFRTVYLVPFLIVDVI